MENTISNRNDEAEARAQSGGRGLRALVVDDDPLIRTILKASLGHLGFVVSEAGNGVEALAATERVYFDVIFMDIVMPEKDGLATTLELRTRGVTSVIIAITAHDKIGDTMLLEAARGFGANDAIKKPFDPMGVARLARARVLEASPSN